MCGAQEAREPLFCLETAVKLLAWSWLVYKDSAGLHDGAGLKEVSASDGSEPTDRGSDSEEVRCLAIITLSSACAAYTCQQGCMKCAQASEQSPEPGEKRAGDGDAALAQAMGMYGLQHMHVIHEKDPDTKVKLALLHQVT